MKWLHDFFLLFERKPVKFVLGDEEEEYFLPDDRIYTLLEEIKKEGYNLDPKDLSLLSKSDQRKLRNRLDYILLEAKSAIFYDNVPEPFKKHEGHAGCVMASLLCMYLCHKHGLPCRLVTCFVLNPKDLAGYRSFTRHMVAECNGWILDAAYGNQGAAMSNTMYMGHFLNASRYKLVKGGIWRKIKLDRKHWYYPEILKKEKLLEEENKYNILNGDTQ